MFEYGFYGFVVGLTSGLAISVTWSWLTDKTEDLRAELADMTEERSELFHALVEHEERNNTRMKQNTNSFLRRIAENETRKAWHRRIAAALSNVG